jgi:Concanavalin A-like lectin/glucanases superfamily
VLSVRPFRGFLALAACLPFAGALACANRGMEVPSDVVGVGGNGGTIDTDAGEDGPAASGGAGGIAAAGGSGGAAGTGGANAGGGRGGNAGNGSGGANNGGAGGGNPGGNGGASTGGSGGAGTNSGGSGGASVGGGGGQSNTGGAGGQANAGGAGSPGTGGGAGGASPGGSGGGSTGGAGGASTGGAGGQALPSPFAYYPFDQTAGPTITDASGNGHNGTLAGTATFPAGVIGNGISLPGVTGDYVALPSALLQTVTNVTIALWVNVRTDHTWQRIFDFGSSQNVYMFLSPHAGGNNVARFAITTSGNGNEQRLDATSVLPLGTWTHVAIVLGAGGGTLYINGAVVATNAALALRPADLGATTNNWLGRSQFTVDPAFDGEIDDLRVYNSALAATQITTIYNAR